MPSLRALPLVVALAATLAAPAFAGDPARDRAAARAFAEAGFRALQAGDYATAIEKLERAEATFHASTNLFFLAKAFEGQGRLLRARELYRQLVAERLPADAPKAFRDAQTNASAALIALDGRLARVKVTVVGAPAGEAVTVTVDGAVVSIDDPVVIDRGTHALAARAAGGASTSATIDGSDPGERAITLDLAPPPPPPAAPAPEPARGSLVPALVAFGVGAVGLGVGIGTGVASLGQVARLKDVCPNNPCPSEHAPLADSARTLGTVSTVGFVVAGVGVGAGVTLLLLRGPRRATGATDVRLGPTSLVVEGSF